MLSPMEMAVFAGVAVLIFGADKLPKLARSAGEMKKEFQRGQDEAHAHTTAAEGTVVDGTATEKQPPTP